MARQFLTSTSDAVHILGGRLAAARRLQRRRSTEVAERAGITRSTLRRIEQGDPHVAVGLYFEVAMVLSVPLFGADARELAELAAEGKRELALLPRRIRDRSVSVDDDF